MDTNQKKKGTTDHADSTDCGAVAAATWFEKVAGTSRPL
jgi:hypothetical protein